MFNFEPTASKQHSTLGRVLSLAVDAPEVVSPGSTSQVKYTLSNISTESLDICVDGQGVSTWVSSDATGAKFPSVLYSVAFDSPCYTPITLKPAQAKGFIEKLVIPKSFPAGRATLHATIALKWPRRRVEEVLGASASVRVVAGQ